MIDQAFISERREQIVSQIDALEKQLASGNFEEVGSNSDDDSLEFEEFEENVALSNQAKKELSELKAAMKRIDEGSYGKCEKCQEMIEAGRLKAFPASRFCSTHAK